MAEYVRALSRADVAPGQGAMVDLKGRKIAIFNVDGTFYALDDNCTHVGGPLSEGEVDGKTITCPWHGARFDLTDGSVSAPPAVDGVNSYEVNIKGEDVLVKL